MHINIGSNLGEREENLARARQLLREFAEANSPSYGIEWRESAIVESEPWGFDSPNKFLNQGVSFESELQPMEILKTTQAIERQLGSSTHRNPDGSYADRAVDIDIIIYGDHRCQTPELTLPHPRFLSRQFVLGPLREIDPDLLILHEIDD